MEYLDRDIDFSGIAKQKFYSAHIALQKELCGFTITPEFTVMREDSKPLIEKHVEVNDSIFYVYGLNVLGPQNRTVYESVLLFNDNRTKIYYQYGLDLMYTYRFNKMNQLNIGIEIQMASNKETKFYFRPYISGNIGRRIEYGIWALKKNFLPLAYNNGAMVYNSHDINPIVLNCGLQYNLSSKISCSLNYIYSETIDSFVDKTYFGHLILFGIKVNV